MRQSWWSAKSDATTLSNANFNDQLQSEGAFEVSHKFSGILADNWLMMAFKPNLSVDTCVIILIVAFDHVRIFATSDRVFLYVMKLLAPQASDLNFEISTPVLKSFLELKKFIPLCLIVYFILFTIHRFLASILPLWMILSLCLDHSRAHKFDFCIFKE